MSSTTKAHAEIVEYFKVRSPQLVEREIAGDLEARALTLAGADAVSAEISTGLHHVPVAVFVHYGDGQTAQFRVRRDARRHHGLTLRRAWRD